MVRAPAAGAPARGRTSLELAALRSRAAVLPPQRLRRSRLHQPRPRLPARPAACGGEGALCRPSGSGPAGPEKSRFWRQGEAERQGDPTSAASRLLKSSRCACTLASTSRAASISTPWHRFRRGAAPHVGSGRSFRPRRRCAAIPIRKRANARTARRKRRTNVRRLRRRRKTSFRRAQSREMIFMNPKRMLIKFGQETVHAQRSMVAVPLSDGDANAAARSRFQGVRFVQKLSRQSKLKG
jgi:hypothetical protein